MYDLTPIPGRLFHEDVSKSKAERAQSLTAALSRSLPPHPTTWRSRLFCSEAACLCVPSHWVFLLYLRQLQGYDYNTDDTLQSSTPAQTLRLALRYGVTAIDTSPYYTIAEEVLGKALDDVRDEFPRSSYQIITKAGRYGRTKADGFDYSPERVRSSIKKSMELLKTDYIDGVYMHDVEFVAEQIDDAGNEGWKVGPDGKLRCVAWFPTTLPRLADRSRE